MSFKEEISLAVAIIACGIVLVIALKVATGS